MLTLVSALLAFLSGFLSVLSPCVLPLLPVVLASLLDRQRTGRWMLAIGLALSFALGGLFIGAVGWRIGVDGERLHTVGACGLLLWGMVLCLPVAGRYAGHLASPLASRAAGWLARVDPAGIWGPFLTGVLLGAVWAPTVGGGAGRGCGGDSVRVGFAA